MCIRDSPDVYDALKELSEKIPLYIVSNCQTGYDTTCIETSGIEDFISGHLCYGETLLPKSGSIRKLMEREGLKDVVYVGDTPSDAQA